MRMTVAEASSLMGVSRDYIRVGLQRGLLPFGTAVKMSNRYTYYINAKKFFEYLGVEDYAEITSFYTQNDYTSNYERGVGYDSRKIKTSRGYNQADS